MKKTVKYLAIGVGVLVVLALVVPFLIPTDTYKKFIMKEVESKVAVHLDVASMRVRLLPLPGFTLKGVKVANAGGAFDKEPIVAADEITGSVSLMPLFSKQAIVSLKLVSPEVYYRTAKDGTTNVDGLTIPTTDDRRPTTGIFISNAYADDKQTPKSEWSFFVKGLAIKDGKAVVTKTDEKPIEIKHLDLELSDFSPTGGKSYAPFHLAMAVLGGDKQNIKIDGKLNIDLGAKTVDINDWKLVLGSALFTLNASANYGTDLSAELKLKLAKATIGDLLSFDPRLVSQIPKDISSDVIGKTPLAIDMEGSFAKKVVSVKKLSVAVGGTNLSANGTVSTAGDMPVDLTANLSPIKMEELRNLIPALRPIGEIADPNVSLKIGGSAANPKKLNVAGHVASKKVRYQEYEISEFSTDFRYASNQISLTSLKGNLYGGVLNGSGALIMGKEPSYNADVNLSNVDMSRVPATRALLKGTGTLKVTASGSGTESVQIKKNLKANGNIHLANGDIPSLKLGDKIFGNQVWNILAKPGVIIDPRGLKELRSLDASCKDFNANFKIENGVITTPDVKWVNAKYHVNLSGSVAMDERLDYKGEFALSKPSTNLLVVNQTARNILANKTGELSVPFDISGTASDPNVRPDEKYLTGLFGKAIAELTVGRAKEAVKNAIEAPIKVEQAGKKLLQGIFGK